MDQLLAGGRHPDPAALQEGQRVVDVGRRTTDDQKHFAVIAGGDRSLEDVHLESVAADHLRDDRLVGNSARKVQHDTTLFHKKVS